MLLKYVERELKTVSLFCGTSDSISTFY